MAMFFVITFDFNSLKEHFSGTTSLARLMHRLQDSPVDSVNDTQTYDRILTSLQYINYFV